MAAITEFLILILLFKIKKLFKMGFTMVQSLPKLPIDLKVNTLGKEVCNILQYSDNLCDRIKEDSMNQNIILKNNW